MAILTLSFVNQQKLIAGQVVDVVLLVVADLLIEVVVEAGGYSRAKLGCLVLIALRARTGVVHLHTSTLHVVVNLGLVSRWSIGSVFAWSICPTGLSGIVVTPWRSLCDGTASSGS